MNGFRVVLIMLVCWVLTLSSANAHIEMVYPKGGEVFKPGSVIAIQWRRTVSHNQMNWDVYYSSDGGTTWQAIKLDLPV